MQEDLTALSQFDFNDQFQQGIIELMTQDSKFCFEATNSLKTEFFRNQYYAKFYDICANLYREFEAAPTPMQIVSELQQIKLEERQQYSALFERIFKPTQQRDHDYIRSRLGSFVKKAMVWQMNRKVVAMQNGDPSALVEMIEKEMETINKVSFAKDNFITVHDIDRIMVNSAQEVTNLIPLGFPDIDKALGGGVPRQTLTTFLGATNVGKSMSLVNVAYHNIISGKKVLYVNLEGEERQPMLRLTARALMVPYGRVRLYNLSEHEINKKKAFVEKYSGSLRMRHMNIYGYTVEDLYTYAHNTKQDFDFDVLIVDYGQILSSKKKHEGLRHEQAYVHRALASMASSLDVAVITVAQGTRETQEKNRRGSDLIRMNDISECFEIARSSAQVLTLNRSDQDNQNERVRVVLDKQRDGRVGLVQICKTNFTCAALMGSVEEGLGFSTPEEYLSESLDSQVKGTM